jgi:hypothetical protein
MSKRKATKKRADRFVVGWVMDAGVIYGDSNHHGVSNFGNPYMRPVNMVQAKKLLKTFTVVNPASVGIYELVPVRSRGK